MKGAENPQDCDWPMCGCDPAANKVIEALDEAGAFNTQDQITREKIANVTAAWSAAQSRIMLLEDTLRAASLDVPPA